MSKGRAHSKASRDARYHRAVARQIALHAADAHRYAPVEDFLRKGDTVDMFVDQTVVTNGGAR